MQRLDVYMCRESFYYCTDHHDRFLPAPSSDADQAIASSPGPELFIACRMLAWGRGYTCLHSEMHMGTLTAAKWRRVSSSQMK